ncbi:MAG: beta-lactamase family protein [Actinobacteria bacterium]|nr:beta-lactamase family protein [Actinomycetota bacterium]
MSSLLAVGVVLVVALGLVANAQAKPLSKADQEFVNSTVEAAMKEEGQPGIMLSITGPKGDYTKAWGVRDVASGAPLTTGDHFRVGSITKTFTATAILRQVEMGHLKLSDTLGQYIGGIANGNIITIRDLLDMQSGVYEYESEELDQKISENLLLPFGPQDALQLIREGQPQFAPGEKTVYTNSNYVLLGLILEQVSGETAEAAITTDVIKPLGLQHTNFATTAEMPKPFTQGYCSLPTNPLANCTAFNPGIFWTAGAINSTLADMSKYSRQLATGALLSPAMQAERLTFGYVPYPFEGPSVFGYGLGILSFGQWLGHDGEVPGYATETMYEPRSGASIVGVENFSTPTLAIFSRIFERIGAHLYPGSME